MATFRFGAVFLASRVVLVALVHQVTGGSEISGDVAMHVRMMHAPLELLLGRGPFAQHPPLLALVEGAVFRGFEPWLTTFLAVRATYVVFETLAALLVHAAIRRSLDGAALRRVDLLLCTLPCGFMASCVMPQDECVAYAFMAAAMWALARGRNSTAVFVLSLGVAAAKFVLLIPLLACVLLCPGPRLPIRLSCALAPAAVFYVVAWLAAGPASTPAVLRFAPPAAFSVNVWALLSGRISPEVAKSTSSVLGLALALIAGMRAWRSEDRTGFAQFQAASSALTWFLVGFYLVNPEYIALLTPALALGLRQGLRAPLALGATALPWFANFAYGIRYCVEHDLWGGAKGRIARMYLEFGLPDPAALHATALIMTTLALAWLAWMLQHGSRDVTSSERSAG